MRITGRRLENNSDDTIPQIAFYVVPILAEKMLGNMRRQQIEKDSPVAVLPGVHLLFLFLGLALPLPKSNLQGKELSASRWYWTTTKKTVPAKVFDIENNKINSMDRWTYLFLFE